MIGILAWLKANKLIGVLIVGIAAFILIGTIFHLIDAATDEARDAGAVTERAATQADVIQNVEKANEARADVRDPRSCAAYVECLRSARNTANCVRFMPDNEGCAVPASLSGGN